jgi:hypothetical protein
VDDVFESSGCLLAEEDAGALAADGGGRMAEFAHGLVGEQIHFNGGFGEQDERHGLARIEEALGLRTAVVHAAEGALEVEGECAGLEAGIQLQHQAGAGELGGKVADDGVFAVELRRLAGRDERGDGGVVEVRAGVGRVAAEVPEIGPVERETNLVAAPPEQSAEESVAEGDGFVPAFDGGVEGEMQGAGLGVAEDRQQSGE